jgi:hypothetical protein
MKSRFESDRNSMRIARFESLLAASHTEGNSFRKNLGLVVVHYYFNSLSLLEKFPISSTSIIKKDNILSRNANLPVESVLQIALNST